MVSRLSGMEAVSLHTESSTVPAHAVALIIIEASDQLSHQRLRELVGSALPQLARFRCRLVGKPLGLGQPVWAEIDDYDPTSQIHSATVPAPGGRREFAELIAWLTTGALDRHKPLWEAWSIDGLEGGRWALAVKVSPAVSDGVAGAVPGVLRAAGRRLRGTGEPDQLPQAVSGPVPRTVFNAPLTERRAVAFASIPLADMKTVNNAFGGSITNVFLAACTLSLRAWLQRHDAVPDGPLLMQVPLSLPDADSTTVDNQFTFGRIRIPVQLDDPVQVLTDLHAATERLNTAHRSDAERTGLTVDFATFAALIPPTVVHAGMQLYTGLGLSQRFTPICHGIASTISGPPVPVYCAGAKVVGMHTAAPLVEGCGLNITLISHGDVMDLSVCVCPDNVPAVNDIATGIVDSVGILVAAAQESPRGERPSVLTQMTSHTQKRSHARH
jgi:diacylglycerol O-acyltransferase / wax synthase